MSYSDQNDNNKKEASKTGPSFFSIRKRNDLKPKKLQRTIRVTENENNPILRELFELYRSKNELGEPHINNQITAAMMNAAIVAGQVEFRLSRSIIAGILAGDENIPNRNSINSKTMDAFMAAVKADGILVEIEPPVKPPGKAKAGRYRLTPPELVHYISDRSNKVQRIKDEVECMKYEGDKVQGEVQGKVQGTNTTNHSTSFQENQREEERETQTDSDTTDSIIGSGDLSNNRLPLFGPAGMNSDTVSKLLSNAIENAFKIGNFDLKSECRDKIAAINSALYSNKSKTEYPSSLRKVLLEIDRALPTAWLEEIVSKEINSRFKKDASKAILKPGSWLHKGIKSEVSQVLKDFEKAPRTPLTLQSESLACSEICAIVDYAERMDCMMEVRRSLAPGLKQYFGVNSFLSRTLSGVELRVLLAVQFEEPGRDREKYLFYCQYLIPVRLTLSALYCRSNATGESTEGSVQRSPEDDELPVDLDIGLLYEECCDSTDDTDYDSLDFDGLVSAIVSRPLPSAAQYVSFVGRHQAA